jgi:ferrous iron transport protein B
MELPPYRLPNLKNIVGQMYTQGRSFVLRAGTVILALTIILWALSYYPRPLHSSALATTTAGQPAVGASEQLAGSYLGRTGKLLEGVSMHLGWDWRISVAVLASFPAREVIVSTLGTLFHLGEDEASEPATLIARLREARWEYGPRAGTPLFSAPVALSVMVFFALCCQCMATLATIRRETNTWRWPLFVFSYMTVLACLAAWLAFQAGTAIGLARIS